MKKNSPIPMIVMNPTEPTDLACMLCMCTVEFFQSHMDPKTAQENHASFLASIEESLLSEDGKRVLHAGWEKYLKLVEEHAPANH